MTRKLTEDGKEFNLTGKGYGGRHDWDATLSPFILTLYLLKKITPQ